MILKFLLFFTFFVLFFYVSFSETLAEARSKVRDAKKDSVLVVGQEFITAVKAEGVATSLKQVDISDSAALRPLKNREMRKDQKIIFSA